MNVVIDPAQQIILERLRALPAIDMKTVPIAEARANSEQAGEVWRWSPYQLAKVHDLTVPGATNPMRARLYVPTAEDNLPVVVFAHGGGWTQGSIDTHDSVMRNLAAKSGCAVLGFDYRLSPEHPFPAPMDDVLAALAFVESGGLGRARDARRIALAGDSAGANLALGALIARRDSGLPLPRTATLFYGCYGPVFDTDSHRRCGDGTYLLSTVNMQWYWRNFLGQLSPETAPPSCAPLNGDLTGLPPLYLNAAALDPLRDDTVLLAGRLAAAGNRYRLDVFPGVVHGFLRFARELPVALDALDAAAEHLKAAFNDKKPGRNHR